MSAEIEAEFDAAVASMGGKRLSEYVGQAPTFENADYIFPEHKVIAELKCLDEDKINDERIIEKASELYIRELKAGRAPEIIFGTVRGTTEGYSEEYTHAIANLYRTPVQFLLKKANSQIKSTRDHLQAGDHIGLVIVANNRHSALDPVNGAHLIGELLNQQTRYNGINGAVYFNADQRVIDPRSGREVSAWVDISRAHLPPPPEAFLEALRRAWYQRVVAVRGLEGIEDVNVDLDRFAELANRT